MEKAEISKQIDFVDGYVANRLEMRRKMLGLTRKDLAEVVNVSIQQINKYEKASNRISSGKLYRFTKYLQIPIEYFFLK